MVNSRDAVVFLMVRVQLEVASFPMENPLKKSSEIQLFELR